MTQRGRALAAVVGALGLLVAIDMAIGLVGASWFPFSLDSLAHVRLATAPNKHGANPAGNPSPNAPTVAHLPSSSSTSAPTDSSGGSTPGSRLWQAEVQQRIANAEYAIRDEGGQFRGTNRAQNISAVFNGEGAELRPRNGAGAPVRIRTVSLSRGPLTRLLGPSAPVLEGCRSDGAMDTDGRCLERLQSTHNGVTEVWENRAEGIEHTLIVHAMPAGLGKLIVKVAVQGAEITIPDGGAEARIVARGGPLALRYSGLKVWDASGDELVARMESRGRDIALVIDDSNADYPLTIDPLLTSVAWTTESNQASALLGHAVSGAGDVNGDGYGDVVVTAAQYTNGESSEGAAFIYLGSASGLSTVAAATLEANQAGAYFGWSAAAAGDVNGDGYGDVIVGARNYADGQTSEGAAFLYLGSSSGLASAPSWTAQGGQVNALFGASVASAGDVNGDGFADVVVGSPGYDNGQSKEGRAFAYLGSASGLGVTSTWTAESDQIDAGFGYSVSSAGDVNGDGYADVIVGASGFDAGQTDEGRAFVYLGSSGGISSTAAWTAESNQATASFGNAVANAGDINGDGYGDVIVGAYLYDAGQADEGAFFVYKGSASGLGAVAAHTIDSNQAGAWLGYAVASASDVNGDGYGDIVVGASRYTNGQSREGRVWTWMGAAAGIGYWPEWTDESNQADSQFGASVAAAGDVNGDGYGDVIVGARGYSGGEAGEGSAVLHLGTADGPSLHNILDTWTSSSASTDARLGYSVASAGDLNGDGFGDVVIGAPMQDNGGTNTGSAFVQYGSSTGLAQAAEWQGYAALTSASGFGSSVASAGDVNGDGYGDLIVGAPTCANGEQKEGRAFVYLGTSSGLNGITPAWTAEANQADAQFGTSVASAGDVNGDGYADVIVGAPLYDGGNTDEGRASVYLGSPGGLSSSAAWSVEANHEFARLGSSVASAGDVNGDGYDDLIVGAPTYTIQDHEGMARLYLGSASGLSTTPAWSAVGGGPNAGFGTSVASAGDVNGDGYSDVIVGAGGYTRDQIYEGGAFVYLGSASGLAGTAAWTAESDQASAIFGASVSNAGDVNGDGYGDVIVGAYRFDNPQTDEGRALVYLGSSTGLSASAAWSGEPDQAGAEYGRSVATAGDVNGDGYGDLIVGAHLWDAVGPIQRGQAFMYLGNSSSYQTIGIALPVRAFNPASSLPIATRGKSSSFSAADVVLARGRSPMGRSRVKLQIEAKPRLQAFDGTGTVSSVGWADTLVTGAQMRVALSSLTSQTTYHWRARVLYDPTSSATWLHSRWLYPGANGEAMGPHFRTAPCVAGYAGSSCQYADSSICNGHGTAQVDGSCVCSTGFTGAACDSCATNSYNYPSCSYCLAATTCNAHGSCNSAGSCACSAGYTGAGCQYSDATTCNGHGTAQVNGSCSCAAGYSGATCNACATNYYSYATCSYCLASTTCGNHGSCNAAGACACSAGYAGANCQYSNAATCSGHGTAQTNGTCACTAGYSGANCGSCATDYYNYSTCTYCAASTTCGGRGSCTASGGCACGPGYAGSSCQYSDATTCNGHGTAQANGTCQCAGGYTGSACQYGDATTCNAHGTAQSNGSCSCAMGYAGTTCSSCSTNYYNYAKCTYCLASTTCNGQGSCGASGACACNAGSAGSGCQYSDATTCSGHGTAQANGTCACSPGFAGAKCGTCAADRYSYPTCTYCLASTTCGGLGSCDTTGACACSAGHAGSSCQYDDATTCNGHGTAQANGSCACAPGYAGPGCQYGDTTTCSGHGTAQANGSCSCNAGYAGAACSSCATDRYNYPTCAYCSAPTTCAGNGSCSAIGACLCSMGYAGGGCQHSDATTCSGHGTAQANGTCACSPGFAGAKCGTCAADRYSYPTCTYCLASTTCGGRGACAASGECTCGAGYAGSSCQYSNAATCNGHGTAQANGSCVCTAGFAGVRCSACAVGYAGDACQYTDAATCNGHGAARSDGGCDCDTAHAGTSCSTCSADHYAYPSCKPCQAATTCNGAGTCSGIGGCACSAGFAGAACEYGDAANCNGRGAVSGNGTCACQQAFAGTSCQTCAATYAGVSCQYSDGATCSGHGKVLADGACLCHLGFAGPACGRCRADYAGYPSCILVTDAGSDAGVGDAGGSEPDSGLADGGNGATQMDAGGHDAGGHDADVAEAGSAPRPDAGASSRGLDAGARADKPGGGGSCTITASSNVPSSFYAATLVLVATSFWRRRRRGTTRTG